MPTSGGHEAFEMLGSNLTYACDELSACQDCEEALSLLKDLQDAIELEASWSLIHPREVFLTIQGLMERLEKTAQADVLQKLHEEVLCVTAALACECVGPAWWNQLLERTLVRRMGERHFSNSDHEDTSSLNSVPIDPIDTSKDDPPGSPLTLPVSIEVERTYPSIPESLPTSMIVLACKMDDCVGRRHILQSQLKLVSG